MGAEGRGRAAERLAMGALPCGRAARAPGTASGDGTRAQVPGRSPEGRGGAPRAFGEVSGGRPAWR